LPEPGTRVRRRADGLIGVVRDYETHPTNVGTFPVQWQGWIWETCGFDDVIVMPVEEVGAA
jgi:hypothetical protein